MKGIKLRRYRGYRFTKRSGKFIRDNFAPNPTESFGVLGILGKILGVIVNFIILIIVRPIAFAFSGIFYKKGEHPAWVGSVLYTVFFVGIMGVFGAAISSFFR